MGFFLEVLVTGLLVGIMYSLVALGFALIFKASDVFNMAQGDMSLLAGLALVGFLELNFPLWLALVCTIAIMTVLAYGTVFIILKPLVARPPIMLFMATFGLAYMIQGIGQSIWGTQAKGLNLGIPDIPVTIGGLFLSTFDLTFGAVAGILVAILVWFFHKTRTGRALRAMRQSSNGRPPSHRGPAGRHAPRRNRTAVHPQARRARGESHRSLSYRICPARPAHAAPGRSL